ncbi:bacillithiol biosynthesis cysteine-adding enzyme BshC [Pseudochryseolinea flava]|uniref:Putative cysteine ligase BshC n=1 Tax=Pseudochryseolinea flava TaxID=2059302 RepID=A0A364Y8K3_9BACT|nr:bacillithiol biosynthesis cysteine-adding enzyme BshC [Pseudochryseolinea flava]RAW03317.1 bacillithiol biosynthesis cysteine-adding enzyme BshC [Pseudochryseolinea flava]
MKLKKIPFSDTHAFNSFFLDYIQSAEKLKPFYHRFPNTENFKAQIAEKSASFSQEQRQILVDALNQQYKHLTPPTRVSENIAALKQANTFTVTTGHQLNIFTGPLYFVYKIVTVLNTCEQLQKLYPEQRFVPVYWMASEDHDYAEIKSIRLREKKYSWETAQQGAVGRFSTQGLSELAKSLPSDAKLFIDAYAKNQTLADAVRQYVTTLFGERGVVVIDADDKALKSTFKEVIRQDVLQQVNKPIVEKATAALEALHYKTQIHCREINFFYLDKNLRSRLEEKDGQFQVVDTELTFTREAMEKLIDEHPEKFSPNVILRPLYQEMILPNLAYAGGPAEVIYWLQLKGTFEHFNTPFPILMPRNFGMVMDAVTYRKFEKTGLSLKDLFEEKNYLFNHWVLKNSERTVTVGEERAIILDHYQKLEARAATIDKSLIMMMNAETKRALNSLEKIERKFLRAEKRRHTDKLRQIEAVKDTLFPNGSLQERVDNILNFYPENGSFIDTLIEFFDPFDFQFNVIVPD